ncbi:hypothetical protein TNCV_2029971 [Trichonephila clavipes]|nr:hypothetical protein TNCV_2029971 [Trichonephila clavipes]
MAMIYENSGSSKEDMEESRIGSEFNEITPEQACNNLQLLWGLAGSKEAKIIYIKDEFAIQEKTPIFEKGKVENLIMDKIRLEAELQSSLGELALISCPILTSKIHYPRGNNPNAVNSKPKSPRGNNPDSVIIKPKSSLGNYPNDVNSKPKLDPNPKNINSKNNNDRVNQNKRIWTRGV